MLSFGRMRPSEATHTLIAPRSVTGTRLCPFQSARTRPTLKNATPLWSRRFAPSRNADIGTPTYKWLPIGPASARGPSIGISAIRKISSGARRTKCSRGWSVMSSRPPTASTAAYAKLRAAAIVHAQFFENNPDYLELTVQECAEFRGSGPESHREYHEKLIERMEEILRQGIESGELRPVDTRETTLAMGCLLFVAAFLTGFMKSVGITQMSEYAVEIFLRGLCREPVCSAEGPISSSQSGAET